MFDHICNFKVEKEGLDVEELELDLIDFGVEEVFLEENDILIYAPFEYFGVIQSELEKRDIVINSSGFDRIPNVTKNLNEEEFDLIWDKIYRSYWKEDLTYSVCFGDHISDLEPSF